MTLQEAVDLFAEELGVRDAPLVDGGPWKDHWAVAIKELDAERQIIPAARQIRDKVRGAGAFVPLPLPTDPSFEGVRSGPVLLIFGMMPKWKPFFNEETGEDDYGPDLFDLEPGYRFAVRPVQP